MVWLAMKLEVVRFERGRVMISTFESTVGKVREIVDNSTHELIDCTTYEEIVGKLIQAGVAGTELRGGMTPRKFRKVYQLVDAAVSALCEEDGYELHVEPGTAILGYRQDFWPTKPFTLVTADEPLYPESIFRHCPQRKRELAYAS